MNSDLSIFQTSSGLAADVRGMIELTRSQVARVVNAGMTLLYWRIGMRIQTEVPGNERAEYGIKIVSTLSRQLVDDYGLVFSYSALTRIILFAEFFPYEEIVATLSQQLGWNNGLLEEVEV